MRDVFYVSFIYGLNDYMEMRKLWGEIGHMSRDMCNHLWAIMGNFNVIKNINEKKGGLVRWENYHEELNFCCIQANLENLRYMGAFYTWSNKNEGDRLITSKLDIILVNEVWLDEYVDSMGIYKPNALSDHCPSIPLRGEQNKRKKSHFIFFNY